MRLLPALFFVFLFSLSMGLRAATPIIPLWPQLAPGTENTENKERIEGNSIFAVHQPALSVYRVKNKKTPTPAVMVLPGGGYKKLVMEKEGYKVARWLNKNGISAFVLKYRLSPDNALRDAQRAVSLIRHDAEKYHIDPDKIGVIGFSAGANATANLVMNHDARKTWDAIDKVSSRPDFWIGVYGAYQSVYGDAKKFGARKNISPAFLVHAADDSRVPVDESLQFFSALSKRGTPAELHVFEQGEHGFALETNRGEAITSTVEAWSSRCLEWLKVRGML